MPTTSASDPNHTKMAWIPSEKHFPLTGCHVWTAKRMLTTQKMFVRLHKSNCWSFRTPQSSSTPYSGSTSCRNFTTSEQKQSQETTYSRIRYTTGKRNSALLTTFAFTLAVKVYVKVPVFWTLRTTAMVLQQRNTFQKFVQWINCL